jgi:ATP-dependent DNA ligase
MNSLKLLSDLSTLIEQLNTTNSKLDKINILKKYPQCKQILEYVYDPLKKFNVTSTNVKKRSCQTRQTRLMRSNKYNNIIDLLDDLNKRVISGHDALDAVVIDKQLECRVDEKSINKAFPGLIYTFDVALAKSYEDHKHQINFNKDSCLVSRKIDGCRLITIIDNDSNISFFSRSGNEFLTLSVLKTEIEKICKHTKVKNIVLDGEICVVGENGDEDFKSIVSQIKRKNYTISNPKYLVFDIIPLEDFKKKYSPLTFQERYELLQSFLVNVDSTYIDIVEQNTVNDEVELMNMLNKADECGWEGLILRYGNKEYEGKRNRYMLKLKKFIDEEFKIVNYEIGPYRIINGDTGLEETIETLTNIIIQLNDGITCSVGSGFTIDERNMLKKNRDKIIGSIVTVKYFEKTSTVENGVEVQRLRFPTIKHIFLQEERTI